MSMRGRGRRRHGEEEESHPDERWMASYMDMVTVLMCMFIVLFAMSSVDAGKFEQLRNSLATGFGAVEAGAVDTAEGTVVPPELANEQGEGFTAMQLAEMEVRELTALREQISGELERKGLSGAVQFELGERGLTIRLLGSEAFFQPDSADLTSQALEVLAAVVPTLAADSHEVLVEGHAAHGHPVHTYPTTWELSSARSVNVLRYLVEKGGIAPARVASVAFGSARQINNDTTPAERVLNRRVDILVLADAPEEARQLIPAVDDGGAEEGGGAGDGSSH